MMRALVGLVLTAVSSFAFANHECKFSAERSLDIDPSGLKTLALVLGPSDAHVRGDAGLKRIEVRGKACASEQEWLKDLDLGQERGSDRATVTMSKEHSSFHNGFGSYAYIDLEVRLPAGLALEIQTGSGDAEVAGVAALTFHAGSGDLNADHIAGAATVSVGSGDVVIRDLGSLTVERTGSGDIQASAVRGEVKVGHVGSGDLRFAEVRGGVHIESVGSGDVTVSGAGGDVVVGSVGSGDVTVDGVGGNFVVHSAGSGDLHHRNVTGKIEVPSRHDMD